MDLEGHCRSGNSIGPGLTYFETLFVIINRLLENDYFFQFSGRSERTAAPARHISDSRITFNSASSFS
jgi:hypothetical protein